MWYATIMETEQKWSADIRCGSYGERVDLPVANSKLNEMTEHIVCGEKLPFVDTIYCNDRKVWVKIEQAVEKQDFEYAGILLSKDPQVWSDGELSFLIATTEKVLDYLKGGGSFFGLASCYLEGRLSNLKDCKSHRERSRNHPNG